MAIFAAVMPLVTGAIRVIAMGMARGSRGIGDMLRLLLRHELLSGGGGKLNLKFDVKHNINDTIRYLDDVGKQSRYATAVALTRTVRRLVPMAEAEVKQVFDKPIPFTVRAFGTRPANKATLEAAIYIKPKQAKYLEAQITGGRRKQKSFEQRLASEAKTDGFWVPGQGIKLNSYGNMTQTQIRKIAERLRDTGQFGEVFVGVPRGHPGAPFGIWGRPKRNRRGRDKGGNGIIPLLIRVADPSYRPRFDFRGLVEKHAQRIFNEEYDKAWRQATASIRPVGRA